MRSPALLAVVLVIGVAARRGSKEVDVSFRVPKKRPEVQGH